MAAGSGGSCSAFGEDMSLANYLASRGLSREVIDDLLRYVPETAQELPSDDVCDAIAIMAPTGGSTGLGRRGLWWWDSAPMAMESPLIPRSRPARYSTLHMISWAETDRWRRW